MWGVDRKIRPSQSPSGTTRQASWCHTVILGTDFSIYPSHLWYILILFLFAKDQRARSSILENRPCIVVISKVPMDSKLSSLICSLFLLKSLFALQYILSLRCRFGVWSQLISCCVWCAKQCDQLIGEEKVVRLGLLCDPCTIRLCLFTLSVGVFDWLWSTVRDVPWHFYQFEVNNCGKWNQAPRL